VSKLKLAGLIRESIVDGPGLRFVVFAQGCPHHCPDCHNPHTWSFTGGFETTALQIVAEMAKNPLLQGLTISGGEPFCQSSAMADLAQAARNKGYDIIAYTGFTFEELLEKLPADRAILTLLQQLDILIDGPFFKAQKSYELIFRGSTNQRMIDVPASLSKGTVVLKQL
jgi:anaerobic ribonucleoside-triphosphate reductase activating protein